MKNRLLKSFTLAEVLITLGVIGIVAAMTMPVLVGNYQKKVLETQYKRSISVIANAITLMMAKNDVPGDLASLPLVACNRDAVCVSEEFSKYLPTILKADLDNHYTNAVMDLRNLTYKPNPAYEPLASIFMPPAYAGLVGGYWWNRVYLGGTIFATSDGAYYGVNYILNDETGSLTNNVNSVLMILDVNGAKKPNVVGQDFFQILIDKSGKVQDITCFSNDSCQDETLYEKFGEYSIFDM